MPRSDLTEWELTSLEQWARVINDPVRIRQIEALVAEVRRLRDNESNTRFLMAIEAEV